MKNEHCPEITFLMRLAREAGAIIQQHFCLGMERITKDDDTPLTAADTAINQLVVNSIRDKYPHVRVISEEGNHDVDGAEYTVLCDPIDETFAFCRGIPISSFVISVLKEGRPVRAVIYDPFMDRMWHAAHQQGAFLLTATGATQVKVSSHSKLHRANICMVWWKGSPFNLHAVAQGLMDAGATWGNPLSIAYYGGLLASGEQDATIFPGLNGYETAAMSLIAEEAGGRATDIHGNSLRYGPNGEIEGHIISNGLLHDELVRIVRSCQ